jgi:hypothetical protein
MEVRDCEFIVSLRYSHDRVPLCCCQSNYKLGSRDYACLPSPGIVLPSGRFKPGLNNTSHTSFSPKPNRLIYASIKNQMSGWESTTIKAHLVSSASSYNRFFFFPPCCWPSTTITHEWNFLLFVFFIFFSYSYPPWQLQLFLLMGGLCPDFCIFAESISRVSVCERDGSHCVSRCAWQQQLSLTWLCFHI